MRYLTVFVITTLTSPAHAHFGDHAHFDLTALLAHIVETDHLVFAAITVITGILAYRAGRRAEARAHAHGGERHDPR